MFRSSPFEMTGPITDFDSIKIQLAIAREDPLVVAWRSHQAGNHQLPHVQARTRRPVLRAHLWTHHRLGMPLRQVQAHEAPRRDLRQVRR